MGLNLNQNGASADNAAQKADQQKAEDAAKQNAEVNQTAASGEAAAGIEKAIESADTANPLTPTIDGNDAPNNAGGPALPITAVVEGEDLNGNTVLVEVNESTPVDDVLATFSSVNMTGYSVGEFKFEKGILTFKSGDEEELEAFRKIIDSKNFPPQERARIVEIDVAAAEKYLEDARRGQGGATQKIDSTVGERASKPKSEGDLGSTEGRGN